ncbi:MAG: hypothetical protein KDF63_01995 [Rhodoferax sp.]|mgnify:FL=1|jgi:hypothetical protein|nr:hypothetical protein [Rhodoferax sp.]MCP5289723.1 hypothetical protein [Burkholderiaceae bacterium]
MNRRLRIRLETTAEQEGRLLALQQRFVQACNALALQAHASGVWSRVGLHQLAYHGLRVRFPELGSQMLCNVIYSVSRAARRVFRHPQSPFAQRVRAGTPPPRLIFGPDAPVYFDRHTLNVRRGMASMYSLDGRLRFRLPLAPEDEHLLRHGGIREIALTREHAGLVLNFSFDDTPRAQRDPRRGQADHPDGDESLPEYLLVVEDGVGGRPQAPAAASLATVLGARTDHRSCASGERTP